jgi:hypothetical protein
MLLLQLGQRIQVQSVTVEHPFMSNVESAIQTFHVYRHEGTTPIENDLQRRHFMQTHKASFTSERKEARDNGWYYLGTFTNNQEEAIYGMNGIVEFPIPLVVSNGVVTYDSDDDEEDRTSNTTVADHTAAH